jgi:hypothetical protein
MRLHRGKSGGFIVVIDDVDDRLDGLPVFLFERSRGMERVVARGGSLDYQNRIMTTLFYAPSTRTRLR